MGIKALKELQVDKRGRMTLEEEVVSARWIKPALIKWLTEHPNLWKTEFKDVYDKNYPVPTGANAFLLGTKISRWHHARSYEIIVPVIFYSLD